MLQHTKHYYSKYVMDPSISFSEYLLFHQVELWYFTKNCKKLLKLLVYNQLIFCHWHSFMEDTAVLVPSVFCILLIIKNQ